MIYNLLLFFLGDAAKKKWKSLRDNYVRYKKSVKGVTGQAKKYHKWQWSQQMQFLDDTLRTRPTESNIPSEEIEDFLDSETSEDQNEHEEPETRALPNTSATHLFLSYADTFRKFRPATQAQMKVELATMFAKMELKELSPLPYDDSSSLSGSSASPSPVYHQFELGSTMLYDDSSSLSGPSGSPSPVYHQMNRSSTNGSYESARKLYENYGTQL